MKNKDYKILLVDDEADVLDMLEAILTKEKYTVLRVGNGEEALRIAEEIKPHLIILDVMMPGLDGIETCKEIKTISALNKSIIVFLTARGEDFSQIAGFDAGADDYIVKPINPRLLIRRVKALLRRFSYFEDTFDKKIVGDIVIYKEKYMVVHNDEEIILPRKEFELLWLLVSKVNKVFTRHEIFSTIWGQTLSSERTMDVHVRKVREKLKIDNIKTVKGVGYKFEA